MKGLSSVDDHASVIYLVPLAVTVSVGTVGGVLSSGSDTVTVPLLANVVPVALRAFAENE
jgi:hypothetical protein